MKPYRAPYWLLACAASLLVGFLGAAVAESRCVEGCASGLWAEFLHVCRLIGG